MTKKFVYCIVYLMVDHREAAPKAETSWKLSTFWILVSSTLAKLGGTPVVSATAVATALVLMSAESY